MAAKRVASFLPSATEILYEIGAGDSIVCVTHECDYPEMAKNKPRVIKSTFDAGSMNSKEIDNKVVSLLHTDGDIYIVDEQVLRKEKPDLIIGQGICDVCSPTSKEIATALSILDTKPEVLILDPHNLEDIFSCILRIGVIVDKRTEAQNLVRSLQNRIEKIQNVSFRSRPNVLCVEWLDPLFTAGHWVPQMVEIAGGMNGISSTGSPSRRLSMDEVTTLDPDIIIMMPCGFDVQRTSKEYCNLLRDKKWKTLRSVQNNKVFAVDANSYFSKPGPRTVTGVEILAKIIHPELFGDVPTPDDSFVLMIS